MRLPFQTRASQANAIPAARGEGVRPSGDCGTGQWCCAGLTGTHCRPCPVTGLFGECLTPAIATCALFAEVPSNSC